MMDVVSKAILETIRAAGFTVYMRPTNVAATNQETGEKFIVNYDAVVELAQQIGLELDDG